MACVGLVLEILVITFTRFPMLFKKSRNETCFKAVSGKIGMGVSTKCLHARVTVSVWEISKALIGIDQGFNLFT